MINVVPYANCTGQVVLDAGHGGTDSGAVNNKYSLTEKEQTLKVANRTKALLEADGYSVCMRRTPHSETLSNNDRYTYANTTGARIFVFIHMIGASSLATDYTTTLFGNGARIKNSQTPSLALPTLPAADSTGKMAMRTPYSFVSGVFLKSTMPATIAEVVFITNDKEGQFLSDGMGARQQQIPKPSKRGVLPNRTAFESQA